MPGDFKTPVTLKSDRWELPYPDYADSPDVPSWGKQLTDSLDNVAKDEQGTLAKRPAAGEFGRYYYATDTKRLYRDTGTDWTTVATQSGKSIVSTAEKREAAGYGVLATPDQVKDIVLPTDGLIFVLYEATARCNAGENGRAAIFLDENQVKYKRVGGGGVGNTEAVVQEAEFGNTWEPIATFPMGLMSDITGVEDPATATTGQLLGHYGPNGHWAGAAVIRAAAGTYDVSIRFSRSGGSWVEAKNRNLWVWTKDFPS